MTNEEIKALGLQARAFKASFSGRKPSNDLLFLWFVSKAQPVRKADVQRFDSWLRSPDGLEPHPSPSGLQSSVFPSGGIALVEDAWEALHFVCLVDQSLKLWKLSALGIEELAKEAHRLP